MAPDCIFNVMGLADNTFHGLFITNFISIAFLILCIVLLHVQLVTTHDKLCKLYFSKYFNIIFKKIYHVLQTVIGLYWVARQCRQFYVPKCRSKRNKQGSSQQLIQTMPPTDEMYTRTPDQTDSCTYRTISSTCTFNSPDTGSSTG